MRRRVTVSVTEPAPNGALLLAPVLFGHWGQERVAISSGNLSDCHLRKARHAAQTVWAMVPGADPKIVDDIRDAPGAAAPAWVWDGQQNALTRPDAALRAQTVARCDGTATSDMHCWRIFESDVTPEFWPEFRDLAHHLKWRVDGLGAGLNPAGGRRVAMSCWRGLSFETPTGSTEISHFSEPGWVLPGGAARTAKVRIEVEENAA